MCVNPTCAISMTYGKQFLFHVYLAIHSIQNSLAPPASIQFTDALEALNKLSHNVGLPFASGGEVCGGGILQ